MSRAYKFRDQESFFNNMNSIRRLTDEIDFIFCSMLGTEGYYFTNNLGQIVLKGITKNTIDVSTLTKGIYNLIIPELNQNKAVLITD